MLSPRPRPTPLPILPTIEKYSTERRRLSDWIVMVTMVLSIFVLLLTLGTVVLHAQTTEQRIRELEKQSIDTRGAIKNLEEFKTTNLALNLDRRLIVVEENLQTILKVLGLVAGALIVQLALQVYEKANAPRRRKES
ncbi:MAG: hypothetical protein AB1489_43020 [Acidobacteriota bacterium]